MCNWVHHEGACSVRAARANHAAELCHEAVEAVRELERQQRAQSDALDLFAPPVDPDAIDFWWGVHRACGDEYRRLSRLFWTRCHHPYVYRPLELAA